MPINRLTGLDVEEMLARRDDFYPDSFTPNQSQKLVRSSMLRMKSVS